MRSCARIGLGFLALIGLTASTVSPQSPEMYYPHDRVQEYVPLEHFNSEHNSKITWDRMLRQTSDWEGTLWGKPDWADRPSDDPTEWLTRARHEPGSVYKSTISV